MRLEYYAVEKLKKDILDIAARYLNLKYYRIFFFGSKVAKTNFPRADIDIGIEGLESVPAKIKLQIEEELENIPTLYKLDFVDFKEVSEKFKREAKKFIEFIN